MNINIFFNHKYKYIWTAKIVQILQKKASNQNYLQEVNISKQETNLNLSLKTYNT